MSRTGSDSVEFANLSATPSAFSLRRGLYSVVVTARSWNRGTVTLRRAGGPALREFRRNGYGILNEPAGEFEFVIVGACGVHATIGRIGD